MAQPDFWNDQEKAQKLINDNNLLKEKRDSFLKLQKGYEVITIGGLYGTVDEVDSERKTVVLDVDGVFLTFELAAIKTVLPLTEGIPAAAGVEGDIAVSDEDTAIEE